MANSHYSLTHSKISPKPPCSRCNPSHCHGKISFNHIASFPLTPNFHLVKSPPQHLLHSHSIISPTTTHTMKSLLNPMLTVKSPTECSKQFTRLESYNSHKKTHMKQNTSNPPSPANGIQVFISFSLFGF